MSNIEEKYKKGKKIELTKDDKVVGKIKIVSDIVKFKDYNLIFADITEKFNESACNVLRLDETTALVMKNNEMLAEIGFTREELEAIYCHELGHCFSKNQREIKKDERNVADEIDSDIFAVKQCGISPYVLESALAKTYEYDIKNIDKKENMTQERRDRYVNEMRARKRNVEKLINEFEDKDKSTR